MSRHESFPTHPDVYPIVGGATSAAASNPPTLLEQDAAAAFCEGQWFTMRCGARIGFVDRAAANPSEGTLAELAALRAHHVSKGHTPATDSAKSDWHFRDAAGEFLRRARTASRASTRRKNLLLAAGVLVAQVDAEDYRTARAALAEQKGRNSDT